MRGVPAAIQRWRARLREAATLWRLVRYERRTCRGRPIAELTTNQPNPADAVRWLGGIDIAGDRRHALFCHPASSVSYRLHVAPGESFSTGCALLPEVWDRNSGGVEFSIDVRDEPSSAPSFTRTGILDPGRRSRDRRWRQLSLAFEREGDIIVTLDTKVPDGGRPDYAWAIWGNPAIERPRPFKEVAHAIGKSLGDLVRNGPRSAVRALRAACVTSEETALYRHWFDRHSPREDDLARMTLASGRFAYRPLISVITPVYNTDPAMLRACINSVLAQAYDNWELCLCDDASTSAATRAVLRDQTDPRVRVTYLQQNARISAASNAALAMSHGEFIALLDHDDELTPDALFEVVQYLNTTRDADVIYSDEDKRDEDGGLSDPFLKPDWSPEHLLSAMYTCHLSVVRKSLVDRVGGFRIGYEGAQDHDLMLRLSDITSRIHHLPKVLYHWRRAPQSTATAGSAKPWADDAGRRALADYVSRHAIDAEVLSGGVPGLYRVKFAVRHEAVTIVLVGGRDETSRQRHAAAIGVKTDYPDYELVTAAADPAAVNAVIRASRGPHIVVVDGEVWPADEHWVSALLEYAQQSAIGAVGARIEYSDGRLRHIGIVTCTHAGPARVFHGHPASTYGYFSSAIGVRNYAAVSGECLATRRAVFDRIGGFDERLPWSVADVDYCVRVRGTGRRVVFTPYARMVRPSASLSAGTEAQAVAALRAIWGAALEEDPYYNPNLSRASADYLLDE